jgi:hypothetical protein
MFSCARVLRVMTAFAMVVPAIAAAEGKPQAPQVTVGAEIKQLRFDWDPAKRADYYQVWYQPNAESEYVSIGTPTPASKTTTRVPISAHLLDWVNARYRIAACNAKGCRYSDPIAVTELRNDVVGYFKSDPSVFMANLGWAVDMSEDGRTLVATSHEDVDGVYLNGAVYVFQRSNGEWAQQARLVPSLSQPGAGYDADIAVSADGNVIVIGRRSEDVPNTDPEEFGEVGAVYIFERSGATWTQTARLEGDTRLYGDRFGGQVHLNAAGTILAVQRSHGGPTGVLGGGTVVMYQKQDAVWTRVASIPYTHDGESCVATALSGDGAVVVKSCITHDFATSSRTHKLHVFSGANWSTETTIELDEPPTYFPFGAVATDHRGRTIVAQSWTGTQPKAVWLRRNDGIYQAEVEFLPGPWQVNEYPFGLISEFAASLALSRDGNIVAIGDWKDTGIGTGILQPPLLAGEDPVGAVHVYERSAGEWTQRSIIKPINSTLTFSLFGFKVDLARNGKSLAVGHPGESSNASGVGGDQNDTSLTNSGAVWLY